jgi:hypothetical protein
MLEFPLLCDKIISEAHNESFSKGELSTGYFLKYEHCFTVVLLNFE